MDARSSARFKGEVPEPRPSLASGGMKGAMNLHYSRLLDAELGTLKTKNELSKGLSISTDIQMYIPIYTKSLVCSVCVCVCVSPSPSFPPSLLLPPSLPERV